MGLRSTAIMRGRRGVLFSIMAIVIAAFLTLIFSSRIEPAPDYKMDLIEARINTLYDYANSFYDFSEEASTLVGYGSLYGVATNISRSHVYDLQFDEHFKNCFLTGNITTAPAVSCPKMAGPPIPYYLNQFTYQAQKNLRINSSYSIDPSSIRIDQATDPFGVDLYLNISLNISDPFANMTVARSIHVIIPIDNIPDPFFSVNNYSRPIIRSRLDKVEGSWNYTDMESLYNNHEYRAYRDAVSFLNRCKGNFSPSEMGIESIMNQSNITIDINVYNNISMVDYLFWNRTKFNCSEKDLVRINASLISIGLTDTDGLQIDETHRLSFKIPAGKAYTSPWC